MTNWMRWVLIAGLLGVVACGDDPKPDIAMEPPHSEFPDEEDETVSPRVDLPPKAEWDSVTMPMDIIGGDNGDESFTYSAVLAGYYLIKVQLPDGDFNYEYDAESDTFSDGNLIHRQAGTTLTQTWLYRVTERDEFQLSTDRALGFLLDTSVVMEGGTQRKLHDLGASSILAIILSYHLIYTGDEQWREPLEQVLAFLLSQVAEDGSFPVAYELQYGQLLQAMWYAYAATGEEKYLDTLELSANYLNDHPEIHGYSRYFALWGNEPLTELYRLRPADWIPELVFAMTDPLIAEQHTPDNTSRSEWWGGYKGDTGDLPRWNSALRLETIVDAYRLAVWSGDEMRAATYRESSIAGTHFMLRLQLRKGETDSFPKPEFCEGAVPHSFGNNTLRIDWAHHHANAVIKVVEYLDLEDFPGKLEDAAPE